MMLTVKPFVSSSWVFMDSTLKQNASYLCQQNLDEDRAKHTIRSYLSKRFNTFNKICASPHLLFDGHCFIFHQDLKVTELITYYLGMLCLRNVLLNTMEH